ncbi:MAG: UDP-N-acetylmuramate dehydrogenase, partial [Thermodesulfovibrionales bacterium]|nr:UDP-N-acetylmuramate dehydrogenase [Thermodesulfovibrionales bacterium]
GCVFKNPSRASAGKLLDEAGCKGAKIGEVEVSEVHANFFVNKGNANASDFIRLMELVSLRVEKRFGILLEPEIKIFGKEIAD